MSESHLRRAGRGEGGPPGFSGVHSTFEDPTTAQMRWNGRKRGGRNPTELSGAARGLHIIAIEAVLHGAAGVIALAEHAWSGPPGSGRIAGCSFQASKPHGTLS